MSDKTQKLLEESKDLSDQIKQVSERTGCLILQLLTQQQIELNSMMKNVKLEVMNNPIVSQFLKLLFEYICKKKVSSMEFKIDYSRGECGEILSFLSNNKNDTDFVEVVKKYGITFESLDPNSERKWLIKIKKSSSKVEVEVPEPHSGLPIHYLQDLRSVQGIDSTEKNKPNVPPLY